MCRCILPVSGWPISVPLTLTLNLTGLATWASAAGEGKEMLWLLPPPPPLWLPVDDPDDWQPARTSPTAASRATVGSRTLALVRIGNHLEGTRMCDVRSAGTVALLIPGQTSRPPGRFPATGRRALPWRR